MKINYIQKLLLLPFFLLITSTIALCESALSLRSDGTILVNGQPFFPFGAYFIPFAQSEASKAQALNDMIAAGFNIANVADHL